MALLASSAIGCRMVDINQQERGVLVDHYLNNGWAILFLPLHRSAAPAPSMAALTQAIPGRSARRQTWWYAPFGHWHTSTFVCALSVQGLLAPLVLDRPINGPAFIAWVEQSLAPRLVAGDIVVKDNFELSQGRWR